jgi:hypothetical protein
LADGGEADTGGVLGKRPAGRRPAAPKAKRIKAAFPDLKPPRITSFEPHARDVVSKRNREFNESMASIRAYEDGLGPLQGHAKHINISTMTIEVNLIGPAMDKAAFVSGASSEAVARLNARTFAKHDPLLRPSVNDDEKFQHAIIWKPWDASMPKSELKRRQCRAVHFFYPKPQLHITGPTTMLGFLGLLEYSRRMMEAAMASAYSIDGFTVSLINSDFNVGFHINMTGLRDLLKRTPMPGHENTLIMPEYKKQVHAAVRFNIVSLDMRNWHIQVFGAGAVLMSNTKDSSHAASRRQSVSFLERAYIYAFVRSLLMDNRAGIEM